MSEVKLRSGLVGGGLKLGVALWLLPSCDCKTK